MKTFIEDYKKSKYYTKLFNNNSDIIIIYAGGSHSFQTSHADSDYDLNIITTDGDFKSVYVDWHLKYKGKKVHWFYRPIVDFFRLTCYDIVEYIGVLTLLYIPEEHIIYLNPKYKTKWEYLYENRSEILKHICIELGLSCKSFINFLINRQSIDYHYAQRTYFICLAAYYHLGVKPDFELLKKVSQAKRISNILEEIDFIKVKELLTSFAESLVQFDLKNNRAELRALEASFEFTD